MIDAATIKQAEAVIDEMAKRLDVISTNLEQRDLDIHSLPSAAFLSFVAIGLLIGKSRRDFLDSGAGFKPSWTNAGFKIIDEALRRRGDDVKRFYGRGRRCAIPTREVVKVVVDGASKEVGATRVAINIKLAQETLLFRHLLELCAIFRLLDPHPDGARDMMSAAGGLCEEVIASGHATRNVIQLR